MKEDCEHTIARPCLERINHALSEIGETRTISDNEAKNMILKQLGLNKA